MADTTISSLNTATALSANNFIPISDGTNTTKLGTDSLFGFRNRIINGGMNIWQRGTVINNPTTANFYTADRWGVNRNGDYAADLSVGRVAATGLPGFQYCMALQRNVGSPSTQAIGLWNSNESANTYDLAGGPVTLSFWLKVGANFSTNFITVALYTGTGIDQRIYQYTNQSNILNIGIVPTTTWTRYVFTANMGSTATEIGSYLTWTPTGVAGGDDSVYITGVQLESGTTATPFEFRPIGLELSLCQRYYEFCNYLSNRTYLPSSGAIRQFTQFRVTKRAIPNPIIVTNSSNSNPGNVSLNGINYPVSVIASTTDSFNWETTAGSPAGNIGIEWHSTAAAEL